MADDDKFGICGLIWILSMFLLASAFREWGFPTECVLYDYKKYGCIGSYPGHYDDVYSPSILPNANRAIRYFRRYVEKEKKKEKKQASKG